MSLEVYTSKCEDVLSSVTNCVIVNAVLKFNRLGNLCKTIMVYLNQLPEHTE